MFSVPMLYGQKQPPEVLYKGSCFKKILQYSHENTAVLEFLFNKATISKAWRLVLSCEYCKIFKNSSFEEHLRRATSFW